MPCKEADKLSIFWAETPLPRIPVAKQKYAEVQKQEASRTPRANVALKKHI